MKLLLALLPLMLSGAHVQATPALRAASFADLMQWHPVVAPCLSRQAPGALPELPQASAELLSELKLQLLPPPSTSNPLISDGYLHRLGWRASDGTLFIVSQGGYAGKTHVFGPLRRDWQCLGPLPKEAA